MVDAVGRFSRGRFGVATLRVCFLIHDDYAAGGLQRSTVTAAECLGAGAHEVTIYCVKTLEGGLSSRFDHVQPVVGAGGTKIDFWFRFLRTLRLLIREDRPDVLIGMGVTTSILLVLATLRLRRPLLVGSERAYPPATPVPTKWRWLRGPAFRRLDRIVCQTRQTADWYEQSLGIERSKLVVIPNIVDPARPNPPAPPAPVAAFGGRPLIACVGRLEPQKGFDLALPIFAAISKLRPDARFLVIGEGSEEADLKAMAGALGLHDRLLFLPRLPTLAGLWPAVSVFLLTSRFEGIPNVLAEAMANGVASVAFDCPTGPSELIDDGRNGFLVPLGDVEGAARRCLELLDDLALGRRLGDAARALSEAYSREAVCQMWNSLVANCR